MLSKLKLNLLYLKDTQFANLMTRRIFNVLLIANPYDAFMLEDDGRIDAAALHASQYLRRGIGAAEKHDLRSHHLHAGYGRQRGLRRGTHHQSGLAKHSDGHPDPFQPRHYQAHRQRRPQRFRICILLAGQYRPARVHHQADRRQDEPRP